MNFLMNRAVKKTLITSIIAILNGVVAMNSAQPQESQGRIDLTKLILMYMAPRGSNVITSWETGSIRGTPISWQHAGIKDCDDITKNELDVPFCRSGKVVAIVAGRPTHSILGRVVEPGVWNITLAGGRAGVVYMVIDSDVLSQELSSELLQRAVRAVSSPIQVHRLKLCGTLIDGSEQFSVTAPGKADALAREWWSCGSGGCNIRITVALRKEDAGYLMRCDR